MAQDMNISITNHRRGTNVSFRRYLADVTLDWIPDAGGPRQQWSQTVTMPDIFQNVALDPQMVQDDLEGLAIKYARIIAGADSGS